MQELSSYNIKLAYAIMIFEYFRYVFDHYCAVTYTVSNNTQYNIYVDDYGFEYYTIDVIENNIYYKLYESNTSANGSVDIDYTAHFYNDPNMTTMLGISLFVRCHDNQYSGFVMYTDSDIAEHLISQVSNKFMFVYNAIGSIRL